MNYSWISCINWDAVAAIGTAVAAVAAAIAAYISYWQARIFRDQASRDEAASKILRTFDHSAAASMTFAEARFALGEAFGDWNNEKTFDVNEVRNTFQLNPKLGADFNFVLNHYGRMASAYAYDVIDRKVALELFGFGFIRFWSAFKPYLDGQFAAKPSLKLQYAHSEKLFFEWSHELWDLGQ